MSKSIRQPAPARSLPAGRNNRLKVGRTTNRCSGPPSALPRLGCGHMPVWALALNVLVACSGPKLELTPGEPPTDAQQPIAAPPREPSAAEQDGQPAPIANDAANDAANLRRLADLRRRGQQIARSQQVHNQTGAAATHTSEPTSTQRPSPRASSIVDKRLRSVSLFYGTNRERSEPCLNRTSVRWEAESTCTPSKYYGVEPVASESGGSGLEVGTLRVSFPPDHETGKIERPPRILTFALREEDPEKDVVIAELRSFTDDYEGWVRRVRSTGREQAFIYVHGYATTFAEAARRAAQVAYDLDFDLDDAFRGIPMVFSWPSRGNAAGYLVDYDVSLEATDAFNEFLDLVKLHAGIQYVHVIAHSMGNRVVANALAQRAASGSAIVDQLVLAAPDIFARRFRQRFLNTLPSLAKRVTLYVSDKDRALSLSEEIREGEPRAGQVAGGLLEASAGVERFDAIDASELETDFLAHSYYANNNSMLSDIYCLLKGTPPQKRPLLMLAAAGWRFKPPKSARVLDAGACGVLATSEPSALRRGWLVAALGLLLLAGGWFIARRRVAAHESRDLC
jgi:esterase/lipase superfamily enzyme